MTRVGRPSAGTTAKPSGSGVCGTSEPRMLNSQAMTSGLVSTTGSWLSRARASRTSSSLSSAGRAGELDGVQHDLAFGRGGPVAPDRVDRVVVERHEIAADLVAELHEPPHAPHRVQPRVEADAHAGRHVLAHPALPAAVGDQVRRLEELGVDLLAHLDRVAAVDEHGGLVGRDEAEPGRAREARQPRQPLGAGRQVLVLVLVGARHHESVQAPRAQLLAQRRDAGGAGGGVAALVKLLKHRALSGPPVRGHSLRG